MVAVDLLTAPGAVDDHRRRGQLRILQLILQRHRCLGTARNQHQPLGIMLTGPVDHLRLLSADPVVDLRTKRAHGVAVVGHLDRGDPHIGQNNALDAHPDVGIVGHREVVVLDRLNVAGVLRGVVVADLLKEARVEVVSLAAELDEQEVVVLGQRLDEGLLRAVDALPLEPHAREHRNPLSLVRGGGWRIADWLAAEGRGLK